MTTEADKQTAERITSALADAIHIGGRQNREWLSGQIQAALATTRSETWKAAARLVKATRSITYAPYSKDELINILLDQIEAAAKSGETK